MATFVVGGRYLYTLLGLPATLTAVFGEHHQVHLRLDDGREFQGVWFHHLQDLPAAGPTSDAGSTLAPAAIPTEEVVAAPSMSEAPPPRPITRSPSPRKKPTEPEPGEAEE
jgi:hypothetical protein